MKNFLFTKSLLFTILLYLFSLRVYAQAPTPAVGDYGSIASGKWSNLSTWKQWDGTGWNTNPTGGPGSSHKTFILSGDTVTYDIDAQKSTSLIIETGAVLKSDSVLQKNGLTVLSLTGSPAVLWVDGTFGSPTDALMLEQRNNTSNSTLTIGGSGTINIAQLRPYSSGLTTPSLIFSTNVNINYAGLNGLGGAGIYTSRGTITTYTISIDTGVTVNFAPNSNLMMSPTSGALGKVSTVINIYGTLNLPSSSAIFADTASKSCTVNIGPTGSLNVGGYLVPFISGVNNDGVVALINVASGGSLNILNGGTADFSYPNATITGSGTFTLNSGSTINIGASAGLDPAFGPIQTTGKNTFSTAANYFYVGTSAQATGGLLPFTVNNLTINDTAGVSITDSLNINGLMNIINGKLNVGKYLSPNGSIINVARGASLNILSGGIVDLTNTNAKIAGEGSFSLSSGGTIRIGAAAGLDTLNGQIQNKGIKTFSTGANYSYTGTTPQLTGSILPDTVNNLTINDTAGVTTSDSIFISGILTINGKFINNYGVKCNDTVVVNGVYQHNMDGGVIPTAKWNFGSTCLVTGSKTLGPTGANQNFYNLIVNCDSLTLPSYPCHFDMANNIIEGDLIIKNTNSVNPSTPTYYALTGYEVLGSPKTITINGNLIIDSLSSLSIDNYSSTHTAENVNVIINGNLSVANKGNLSLTAGSAKNLINLIVKKNVTLENGASLYSHSKTTDSLIFAGTSTQTYRTGVLSNNNYINTRILRGAFVDMDTSIFSGSSSTFTLDPGGTIATAHSLGLNGNINVGGTKTLSNTANYIYNGSVHQVTGSLLPDSISNLKIDNSAGVTLSQSTTINDTLFLINGVFDNSIPFIEGINFKLITVNGSLKNPVTNINETKIYPLSFKVDQNYPNPFNPSTTINYSMKSTAIVSIKIYNILGREIKTLVNEEKPSGNYSVVWDGRDNAGNAVPSGVYFYRYLAGTISQIKKMILLK